MGRNWRCTYEVIVGNVGTVYRGYHLGTARDKYASYVEASKLGFGRAGSEPVTLPDAEPRQ